VWNKDKNGRKGDFASWVYSLKLYRIYCKKLTFLTITKKLIQREANNRGQNFARWFSKIFFLAYPLCCYEEKLCKLCCWRLRKFKTFHADNEISIFNVFLWNLNLNSFSHNKVPKGFPYRFCCKYFPPHAGLFKINYFLIPGGETPTSESIRYKSYHYHHVFTLAIS